MTDNPFEGLTDADMIELSVEWLAQPQPVDAAAIAEWAGDCNALKAERARRRNG